MLASANTGLIDERERERDLLTKDDNTRGPVPDLLILRSRQLDHRLGGRVCYINLSKNCVSIVGESIHRHNTCKYGEWNINDFVCTDKIPPMGSKIIFNMALGPRQVRITSATV